MNDAHQEVTEGCYRTLLERFAIRAKLVIPLLYESDFWGLLAVHQCTGPRQWQPDEIDFLKQLASQVSLAINHANLYQQAQQELKERQRAEAELQHLNQELEQRVNQRTEQLRYQLWQETLSQSVIQRIRESLDLTEILQRTADEVRQVLKADRVLVYQLLTDRSGRSVAESVAVGLTPLLNIQYPEEVFPRALHQEYAAGRIRVIDAVEQADLKPCMRSLLGTLQVKSKLVVPIVQDTRQSEYSIPGEPPQTSSAKQPRLWGLLIVHHCLAARGWQEWQINLVQQIAIQLSVAIQQASLYQQVHTELQYRQQAEAQVRASLQEKEILLKEIHHRVKNNLQIISSLLRLQIQDVDNAEIRCLYSDSQNRIQSMALIHDQLYGNDDLACIDLRQYGQTLVLHLLQSYGHDSQNIDVQLSAQSVSVALHQAVSCGLILNELISNSLKYAFPTGGGQLSLQFTTDQSTDQSTGELAEAATISFSVADNGIGLPVGLDVHNTSTLGLSLVCSLTEQLKGHLTLNTDHGTSFKITFPSQQGQTA